MKIAVIGGGINGIMAAWLLAEDGRAVTLFEKSKLMSATSSASSKLLHGGLRYLEYGQFRLVREALRERSWWLVNAPHLAAPIKLVLPIYRWHKRGRLIVKLGLSLYDWLAGPSNIAPHQWLDAKQTQELAPSLQRDGLIGAFVFYDGQMRDLELGLWAAEKARQAGASIREGVEIEKVDTLGNLYYQGAEEHYDRVVNLAGPWASSLLDASEIQTQNRIELVRGSHIYLAGEIPHGFMLQSQGDRRICFVLPYDGKIMVGTTEMRQTLGEPIHCSEEEIEYLLAVYNRYFGPRGREDVIGSFAGVRPLIHTPGDITRMSREYALEAKGALLNVFGGKWTTSRALAEKIKNLIRKTDHAIH